MFDRVADLLASLSPAVAALNVEMVTALHAEAADGGRSSRRERRAVGPAGGRDGPGDTIGAGGVDVATGGVEVGAGPEGLDEVRRLVEGLDPSSLDDRAAVALHEFFVEGERLMAAGRALVARALQGTEVWRRAGFRSAAQWSAAQAGVPAGPALRARETLELLDGLPLTAAALRAGRLSLAQAAEIADAASEDPEAEVALVGAAQKLTLAELAEECRRVTAAAATDEVERHRRIRTRRFCRTWTDRHGALRLSARLTADEGARLVAEIDTRRDEIIREATAGGWFETAEAHRADALVDVAGSSCSCDDAADTPPAAPRTTMCVWVDYDALVRGYTVAGECCEIPGVGPIPVELARQMATDCVLKVLLTKGVDIAAVAHAGRTIPAHLRTALEARDPTCIVPGCTIRRGLEIDHREPWSVSRDTSLANLARLCRWHHFQKTALGYTYRGGPGTWEWVAPGPAGAAERPPPEPGWNPTGILRC